jgi:hypothetical protein
MISAAEHLNIVGKRQDAGLAVQPPLTSMDANGKSLDSLLDSCRAIVAQTKTFPPRGLPQPKHRIISAAEVQQRLRA